VAQIVLGLVGFYSLGLTNEHCTDLVELLHKKELFAYESSIDLVAFSFFNIFIAYFFLTTEMELNNKLLLQKNSTESLLRVVFHDIAGRASVIGFAQKKLCQFKQNGEDSPENKLKHLTRLENATNEMTDLLNVVRKMSALRDGKEELSLTQADAVTLLKEAADLMSVASEQKNINFNIEVPSDEYRILTDPTIFKNIIVGNIISNAIKFSKENSKIDIRIFRKDKSIRIEIQDYGIGMSKDMIEGIFSIHSKTNRKGTNGEPGTGYGMPLAKEYVEKMGGKISIHSSVSKSNEAPLGSTLILEFPSV
jgi:signal transduction histidine kinase